mgnify:CR=1 FL=1
MTLPFIKNIRLPEDTVVSMIKFFHQFFLEGDELWLFGSRVDMTKRGGDIDLYIETSFDNYDIAIEKKLAFLYELKKEIGDQKIDLVLKLKSHNYSLPIYQIAKSEGVKII